MKFTLTTLALVFTAAQSVLGAAQTCVVNNVPGECVSTSSCSSSGGSSTAGYCPGSADIQCCTYPTCTSGRCGPETVCAGTKVAGLCPGGAEIKCCQNQPPNLSGQGFIASARARQIAAAVKARGLPRQACLASMATALVESKLLNYANTGVASSFNYPYDATAADYDSVGLFQQRAVYYPVSTSMIPSGATNQFLDKMVGITGWQTMDVGTLCQKVQVSAYPDRYTAQVPTASSLCTALGF